MATYNGASKYPPKKPLTGDAYVDFGDYTMKIGKHKGKSLQELSSNSDGRKYLCWFNDNVVNKDNEKFYGKIIKFVEQLRKDDDEEDE